jgi:hypothetical protein
MTSPFEIVIPKNLVIPQEFVILSGAKDLLSPVLRLRQPQTHGCPIHARTLRMNGKH